MDQLDRQQTLYDALGELASDERRQVGTIFALTPDELIAAEENAMENG
ncbi:MAG TPA: hypothetical protein VHY37_04970 [Tepidisphaeraceae bacterium]|jgi:acid stress-induced BolA-like protein IbaG/YrbA|nr:hypothetical protein [Tepidisphaeraceae bacterium]